MSKPKRDPDVVLAEHVAAFIASDPADPEALRRLMRALAKWLNAKGLQ